MTQYAKAIVGGLIAGLSSIQASLDHGLNGAEILAAVIAALVAGGVVFGVRNRPADQRGAVDALLVVCVLLALIFCALIFGWHVE